MWKKHQLIMLPTNKELNGEYAIMLNSTTGYLSHGVIQRHPFNMKSEIQYLYIVSDDEIKGGDLFVHNNVFTKHDKPNYVLHQCSQITNGWIHNFKEKGVGMNPDFCKKVVATTDSSLSKTILSKYKQFGENVEETKVEFLPKPSQEFIKYFVEEYNKGQQITEVEVEYIRDGIDDYGNLPSSIKINFNNEISIKPIKNSWNREEVVKIIRNFNEEHGKLSLVGEFKQQDNLIFKQWIENNL